MLRIFLSVFFISFLWNSHAQSFSDSIRISLLTGSSGNDLYELFGHSAVRVQDFKFRKDIAFNYGTFDFNTSNFYWKFLRGKLEYVLSINDTKRLSDYYDKVGRSLTEQELLLDKTQQDRILQFLVNNYKPENRAYLYDFFYDNCATRIRDFLETELDTKYVGDTTATRSFRQLLDVYTIKSPWADFGIDLLLGIPADKMASVRAEMFLPEFTAINLQKHLKYETEEDVLGTPHLFNNTPLVPLEASQSPFKPVNIFLGLFLLSILITLSAKQGLKIAFDYSLFLLLGLAGSLLLFMWFGTDHQATKQNLNIVWLNPLYLFLLAVLHQINNDIRKQLLWGLLAINILILAFWTTLPQQFHIAAIPIILTALLRCADHLQLVDFKKRFAKMP